MSTEVHQTRAAFSQIVREEALNYFMFVLSCEDLLLKLGGQSLLGDLLGRVLHVSLVITIELLN